VRSSRTGPILKRDRLVMSKLDRKISRLDYQIWIHYYDSLRCEKLKRERQNLDLKRKELRLWMKDISGMKGFDTPMSIIAGGR